jgi:hypothetical protein
MTDLKDKHNEEIGHYEQTLIKAKVIKKEFNKINF